VEKVALFQGQGGPTPGPPPYKERAGAGASIDSISTDSIDRGGNIDQEVIDRMLRAEPRDFDAREIAEARRWVHGYQLKYGRDKNAHPPDDKIVAVLLSIGGLAGTINLVNDLMADRPRPQPDRYSYYVSVAMQRLRGVDPKITKARWAALRIVKDRGRSLTGEQQPLIEQQNPEPQFASGLVGEVLQKRKGKGL
jgi:hypothetical protein